jgi:hypothetical protein
MSCARRGYDGEASFWIFGKQLPQHDQQVRRLPHGSKGKRDANLGDNDLAHLLRADRAQILKIKRKQGAVFRGRRRAQEQFIWSEFGVCRALFDRNHGFPPYTVARMPHGAQPNLSLFLMRRDDIAETIKFADATLLPTHTPPRQPSPRVAPRA